MGVPNKIAPSDYTNLSQSYDSQIDIY